MKGGAGRLHTNAHWHCMLRWRPFHLGTQLRHHHRVQHYFAHHKVAHLWACRGSHTSLSIYSITYEISYFKRGYFITLTSTDISVLTLKYLQLCHKGAMPTPCRPPQYTKFKANHDGASITSCPHNHDLLFYSYLHFHWPKYSWGHVYMPAYTFLRRCNTYFHTELLGCIFILNYCVEFFKCIHCMKAQCMVNIVHLLRYESAIKEW